MTRRTRYIDENVKSDPWFSIYPVQHCSDYWDLQNLQASIHRRFTEVKGFTSDLQRRFTKFTRTFKTVSFHTPLPMNVSNQRNVSANNCLGNSLKIVSLWSTKKTTQTTNGKHYLVFGKCLSTTLPRVRKYRPPPMFFFLQHGNPVSFLTSTNSNFLA